MAKISKHLPQAQACLGVPRRLWPDTLFGQLVLTFSLGFLVLLVLGTLHLAEARQYYMLRGLMSDRARQLANVAILLDTADEETRARLVERLHIRGLSFRIVPEPSLPEVSRVKPREDSALEEASVMQARILQHFMKGSRELNRESQEAGRHGTNGSHAGADDVVQEDEHKNTWEDRPPPWADPVSWDTPIDSVRASVQAVNIPAPLDDILAPLARLFSSDQTRSRPPAYKAVSAVILSDGNWVEFNDTVPGFRSSSVPFTGIVMVEVFFVLISLLAFLLIVRPLRRLARAADSFGRNMPGTPPLPESGPREVREAAQAFNRMQRRILEFVDERSRTLAAVSHDLRTPLTRLRLRVEQLDDNARELLQNDMDELQQLMDTTIDLARGAAEAYAPVDVAALLGSLVEDRQDMGLAVILRGEEDLHGMRPILARPLSLKRCLGNLLDNALRYGISPELTASAIPGGPSSVPVEVSVEDGPEALTVLIRDHGPGIPEEHLNRVFEPFFRLEPSRNRGTGGNGLGLSIARSMARLHGGEITLENAPSGGLIARMRIPHPHLSSPCENGGTSFCRGVGGLLHRLLHPSN